LNPAAGRAGLLSAQLPAMRTLLEGAGYRVEVCATTGEEVSARRLGAAAAVTAELVLACGGDGTVHGVVQGLAHTQAALGVVPLGTANALARNLGLPLDPLAAVARLMTYAPRRIPLGQVETAGETRYFITMAGCGPDGTLVHSLSSAEKARFGRGAYYAHAAGLFFTRRWPAFAVEYRVGAEWVRGRAVAVMASRVADLGGLFSGLTRAAQLTSVRLQVQILRAPAVISFPAWFGLSRVGLRNPWLETVDVDELVARPLGTKTIYAQADAEGLGAIPLRLRVVEDALTLLMPG